MSNAIETSGLTKKFGALTAVDDLSIEVGKGEVLGFLGPNGAGKTTTVRMMTGMIAPTGGYAVVNGIRADREPERLHETIGILTETPGFYEKMSAKRNLEFFADFYSGTDTRRRLEKYLKAMDLWERRNDRVGDFSKGMKQRLALVRALIHEPSVLFFDEPTSGLDPEAAKGFRDLIKNLKEEGRTIFLCTHNLEEAEQLCDRIAVFKTRLVALDTASNLRDRLFRRQVVVELESTDDSIVGSVEALGFVRNLEKNHTKLSMELDDFDKNRPTLVEAIVKAGGKINSVFENKHSLEDVYMTLIREDEEKDGR